MNKLRINEHNITQEELLANIKNFFDKDILNATVSELGETLERDYFFKGENVPIFRKKYTKEVRRVSGQPDVYVRTCTLYLYFENGELYERPISTRSEFYLEEKITEYKINVFNSVLSRLTKKATEEDLFPLLSSILEQPEIYAAINRAKLNADTTPLIEAIESSEIEALQCPMVDSEMTIKECLLKHFDMENFNSIYPGDVSFNFETEEN